VGLSPLVIRPNKWHYPRILEKLKSRAVLAVYLRKSPFFICTLITYTDEVPRTWLDTRRIIDLREAVASGH